jgi:death-on-curing protein
MTEWAWVDPAAVIAWNAEFGGSILNENSVLSALARPANLLAYGNADVPTSPPRTHSGWCRNHGFVDGNKRTAWVTARAFLNANDIALIVATKRPSSWWSRWLNTNYQSRKWHNGFGNDCSTPRGTAVP